MVSIRRPTAIALLCRETQGRTVGSKPAPNIAMKVNTVQLDPVLRIQLQGGKGFPMVQAKEHSKVFIYSTVMDAATVNLTIRKKRRISLIMSKSYM